MTNPFLIGEKIYLRPVERADAALACAWLNEPGTRHFLSLNWPLNLLREEEYIERMSKSQSDLFLVMALKEGDRPFGLCGLHAIDQRNRHGMLGIIVGVPELRGKGLGAEATRLLLGHAFDTLNLHRVGLHVYEYNDRAIRSYLRIGFQKEGMLRQDNFRSGRYWDTVVMGILREEFARKGD